MKKLLPLLLFLCTFNLQAEEISLDHNGLKVSANLEKVGDDWASGPVVLMTHGTLAHNRMEIMATLQELFAEREISTLAINLSLGLSGRESKMYDCPTPHNHKHTDALDEIGLWLGWLKQQGVNSVTLLGHSRGGNQTAWFAAERDEAAIGQVILVAPQVWSEKKNARGYQKSYGKELGPILAKAEKLVAKGKGNTPLKPVDFIYCAETSATAHAFVSYYKPEPRMDTPSLLKQISKPVLVIAGSEDTVVAGLIEKMEGLGQENVGFEVIEDADHFFLDLYAEELADLAGEFLGVE